MTSFIGYEIIYNETNRQFRSTGSTVLKQIADFSSNYFLLSSDGYEYFYKFLMKNAKIVFESFDIENERFTYNYESSFILKSYIVLVPSDNVEFLKAFVLLTNDFPKALYANNINVAKVHLQEFTIK